MEIALASYFDYRTNLIVPNISWGMFIHECDLLVITPAGYAWEVEIKISKQDLVRDSNKGHNHNNEKIKHLYFAIPKSLLKHKDLIPKRAGIITVERIEGYYAKLYLHCKKERKADTNFLYKFTTEQRLKVARLGTMRIWGLKNKMLKQENANKI